jgi:hypothetical protein
MDDQRVQSVRHGIAKGTPLGDPRPDDAHRQATRLSSHCGLAKGPKLILTPHLLKCSFEMFGGPR